MNNAALVNGANLESSNSRDCCREKGSNQASMFATPMQVKTSVQKGVVRFLPHTLTIVASILLLVSLKLPLWRMHLEAPQYRDQEALNIAVHPDHLNGDLRELTVLDQYIGVHVPKTLPQFKWLPTLLIAGAALGVVAVLLPRGSRRPGLVFVTCALAAGLALAAFQATNQIRDIGHKRDQKTVLAGIKDFTPPFLGTSKIAQFTVSSWFGLGAWLIGGALALQISAAWFSQTAKSQASAITTAKSDQQERLVSISSN